MIRIIRSKLLMAQRRFRELIKFPFRRKIQRLKAQRKELVESGKNTKKIDEELAYLEQRRRNESFYGAANAWFTPLKTLRRADKISSLRKKKN